MHNMRKQKCIILTKILNNVDMKWRKLYYFYRSKIPDCYYSLGKTGSYRKRLGGLGEGVISVFFIFRRR